MSEIPADEQTAKRSGAFFFIPLAIFVPLAVYFAIGLTKDPATLPSALIDKPVPEFSLPGLQGTSQPGFTTDDLKGRISVINVFASWCIPCRAEHPEINRLAEDKRINVYGLNYKDTPEAARAFLDELGNNYTAVGADLSGRVGIDFGVYGVPETFIVDAEGRIRHKQVGPIIGNKLATDIMPVIERLLAEGQTK